MQGLSAIKTTDQAAKGIIHSITRAITTIFQATNLANFKRGLQELKTMLPSWSTVVYGSEDQDKSQEVGESLQQMVTEAEASLKQSSQQQQQRGPGQSTSIDKVQSYLKQNINDDIQVTGKLDEQTIRTLKDVESYFNRKSDTTEWTGALISSDNRQIISYNQLVEAFNRIQKY